jgi:hypothetical protein
MAQKIINLGTGPNTPTGDTAYTAFTKVNDNFTELYAGGGGGGGGLYYPRNQTEIDHGVYPVNYNYPPFNVIRYGADPTWTHDSTAAFTTCVNMGAETYIPTGNYYIASPVVFNANVQTVNIYGDGIELTNIYNYLQGGTTSGYINSTTTPNLSYPKGYPYTPDTAGFNCFLFTTNIISYGKINNFRVWGFTFAIFAVWPLYGCELSNISIVNCNALVLLYQGTTNTYISECEGVAIGAATAFPPDSPYYLGGQNSGYYIDGFQYTNYKVSNNAPGVNPYFDAWFVASILRPEVLSYCIGQPSGIYYRDDQGNAYPTGSPVLSPSGWSYLYAPYRNRRFCFGPTLSVVTYEGDYPAGVVTYGCALVNEASAPTINGLVIEDHQGLASGRIGRFVFGAIGQGKISNMNLPGQNGAQDQVPVLALTGRGYSAGYAEYTNLRTSAFFSCSFNDGSLPISWNPITNVKTKLPIDFEYGLKNTISTQIQTGNYTPPVTTANAPGVPNGLIVSYLAPTYEQYGIYGSTNLALDTWNMSAATPVQYPNTYFYKNFSFQSAGAYVAGLVRITVMNTTTNQVDYGDFYIVTGNSFNLTTTQIIHNGDAYIYCNAPPGALTRFIPFTIGTTGVTVLANGYDYTNNRLILESPVAGLPANQAIGTTITKQQYSKTTITPFKHNFLGFYLCTSPATDPYFDWQSVGTFAFVNLVAPSIDTSGFKSVLTSADQSLYFTASFSNVKVPTPSYFTSPPTSGNWATGAIIYNSNPGSTGIVGWSCTAGGNSPTWVPFGSVTFYPRNAVEIAAGVFPTNYSYPPYNVIRYGADPTRTTDSTAAVQTCVNLNHDTYFPPGDYYIQGPVILGPSITSFNIYGDSVKVTNIYGTPTGTVTLGSYIDNGSTVADDFTYPSPTDPGPLKCCFYFACSNNGGRVSNLYFWAYRFAMAVSESGTAANASGIIANANFEYLWTAYCNALIIFYTGLQAISFTEVIGKVIASATCYPAGSPYAFNASNPATAWDRGIAGPFINNLKVSNNDGVINQTFDNWFTNSILRPNVLSYDPHAPSGCYYADSSGVTYSYSNAPSMCSPSGYTQLYMPIRNPQLAFGVNLQLFSFIGPGQYNYGMALINNAVTNMLVYILSYENANISANYATLPGLITVGAIQSATFYNSFQSKNSFGLPGAISVMAITGRGYQSGFDFIDTSTTQFIGCTFEQATSTPVLYNPIGNTKTQLPVLYQFGADQTRSTVFKIQTATAPKTSIYTVYNDAAIGVYYEPYYPHEGMGIGQMDDSNLVIDGFNFNAYTPFQFTDSSGTPRWFKNYSLSEYGRNLCGLMRISVLNTRTNETDYGEYYIVTGVSANYTTAAAVNNGDMYIVLSSVPTLFTRFMPFTISGVTVLANSFDLTNNHLILESPVTGLTGTVASGATITKNQYSIKTITPFQRNFLAFWLYDNNYFPYGNSGVFGFINLVADSITTTGPNTSLASTDQSLYIVANFSNVKIPSPKTSATVPSTSNWATGALVYNSAPAASGNVGWVCTTGGTSPTWQTFGPIAPYATPASAVYHYYWYPSLNGFVASVTGASGNGTTATITFAAIATPIPVGAIVRVSGINPSGYNNDYATITASTTTSISYANTTTASYVSGGFVQGNIFVYPANVKLIQVIAIGGGGGGGSGACVGAGGTCSGGGGGGGGGRIEAIILGIEVSGLTTTTVTVGAAGTGGTAATAVGAGNAGTSGGTSTVTIGTNVISAYGGGGGAGGSATGAVTYGGGGGGWYSAGSGSTAGRPGAIAGVGDAASISSTIPNPSSMGGSGGSGTSAASGPPATVAASPVATYGGGGGGGGGSINAGSITTVGVGGPGQASLGNNTGTASPGAASGINGVNAYGNSYYLAGPGSSGGTASNTAANGGIGGGSSIGIGDTFGSGGGGGGAVIRSAAQISGAGGNGSAGVVVIICYF